jgi:hypothetical protein
VIQLIVTLRRPLVSPDFAACHFRRIRAGANPETKKKDVVWFTLGDDR